LDHESKTFLGELLLLTELRFLDAELLLLTEPRLLDAELRLLDAELLLLGELRLLIELRFFVGIIITK